MLEVKALRVSDGDFTLSADFALPQGSLTVVIGPSGGGKSTLLSAIAGFLGSDAGQMLWGGVAFGGADPGARPVSILFQDNNLFPHLTAALNVGLALNPRLALSSQDRAKIADALTQVGLSGMGDRLPATLSGGQQGRVALARILVSQRPVVLMDEPFAALGPGQRQEMMALVRGVLCAAGKTVLMVTHDPQDAAGADYVIALADGRADTPISAARFAAAPPERLAGYFRK